MTLPSLQLLDSTHTGSSTAPSTILAYGVLFLLFVYYMLQYVDFPLLPISELLWNALVYITPTKVISFLLPSSKLATQEQKEGDKSSSKSIGYARKSEAMRHILGLDGTGIMSNVQRARSMPGIGATMKETGSTAPPGLGNWDNSCYQNSILQGLAALRSLPSYLARNSYTEATHSTVAALRDLLTRLNEPSSAGKMFWTPAELKSMSSWQQQDAQEYFSKVLDEVEKDTSKYAESVLRNAGLAALPDLELGSPDGKRGSVSESFAGAKVPLELQRAHQLPDELASLVLRNPLEGLLAQRVGCLQCGYGEGLTLIPFNCLTVPLGRQWVYDIRSCLDEYTGLESISGVECSKCTLLRTKQQLERLLSQIQVHTPEDGTSTTPTMLRALQGSSQERLAAVNTALEGEDFSDNTLLKKCQINAKSRVSTTKSRQAVIARAPKSLVMHVNRSVFDEFSGAQTKNFADVRFPYQFDLNSWCLGGGTYFTSNDGEVEKWSTDPAVSMLSPEIEDMPLHLQKAYQLRAVVTHYGKHENGHYICYRKYPLPMPSESRTTDQPVDPWWRLSDDEVSQVSQDDVLSQGGVFMLFYEQVEQLHAPVETEDLEGKVPQQNAAQVALEKTQVIEVESSTEASLTVEKDKEEAAKVHEAPEAADAISLPSSVNDVAVQGHMVSEEVETPSEALKETSAANINTNTSPMLSDAASDSAIVDHASATMSALKSAQTDSTNENHPKDVKPSALLGVDLADPETPTFDETSSTPALEEVMKENRQITPTMRTAPPRSGRGSVSRGSKGMGQVSSMVTAN